MQNLELYFDLVFIVLLIMMIFYSVRLNRQLKIFRDYRSDFKLIMKQFNQSFGKADTSIKGLHDLANGSHKDLNSQIEAAQTLSEELKFMVESADRIATRLEKANDRSTKVVDSREEPEADVDYYKSSSQASAAARKDASLTMQQKLGHPKMGKVASLDQQRQVGARSKNEKDLLKVLQVKAR